MNIKALSLKQWPLKQALLIFRLVIVPLLLILLLYHLPKNIHQFAKPNLTLIVTALMILHVYFAVMAYRMYFMLRGVGAKVTYPRIFAISQQALFYLYTIPSTIGYEAARFGKVISHAKGVPKIVAMQAVLLDRASGLIASMLILAVLLPVVHIKSLPTLNITIAIVLLAGIVLLLLCIVLIQTLRQFTLQLLKLINQYKQYVLTLLVISIVAQMLLVMVLVIAYKALTHITVPITEMTFMQSVSNIAAIFPLSIAGISGNEAGQSVAAITLGYSLNAAILLAALVYFAKLIGAIEGGIIEWSEGIQTLKRRKY